MVEHPNIVSMLGWSATSTDFIIIMKLIRGKNLHWLLFNGKNPTKVRTYKYKNATRFDNPCSLLTHKIAVIQPYPNFHTSTKSSVQFVFHAKNFGMSPIGDEKEVQWNLWNMDTLIPYSLNISRAKIFAAELNLLEK